MCPWLLLKHSESSPKYIQQTKTSRLKMKIKIGKISTNSQILCVCISMSFKILQTDEASQLSQEAWCCSTSRYYFKCTLAKPLTWTKWISHVAAERGGRRSTVGRPWLRIKDNQDFWLQTHNGKWHRKAGCPPLLVLSNMINVEMSLDAL